jgi:limonene-1,2-epoxide hydrolase
MTTNLPPSEISGREPMNRAGQLAAMAVLDGSAVGHAGRERKLLSPGGQAEFEKSTAGLVKASIDDHATREVDVPDASVREDIFYQISGAQPAVAGLEPDMARHREMFAGLEKVGWQVLRLFSIGQLVINDRIDSFPPKPGSRVPRMHRRVAGHFRVQDGRTRVRRDFGYPEARPLIAPAPKA